MGIIAKKLILWLKLSVILSKKKTTGRAICYHMKILLCIILFAFLYKENNECHAPYGRALVLCTCIFKS